MWQAHRRRQSVNAPRDIGEPLVEGEKRVFRHSTILGLGHLTKKIKVIKRIAYGFRDEDYFFLKISAVFPGNPG